MVGNFLGIPVNNPVIFYELFQRSLYFLLKCHTMSTPKALLIMKVLFTSIYVFPSHFFHPYYPYMASKQKPYLFFPDPSHPTHRRQMAGPQEVQKGGSYDFHEFLSPLSLSMITCLNLPSCLITFFLIIILINVSDLPLKKKTKQN